MSQLVTSSDELQRVRDRLMTEPVVAVDTEFFWERTFYPILGLVQVSVADGTCWLLDTVKLPDIAPLGAVLANPGVVKILHDAQQDLTILIRAAGKDGVSCCPANVFDTRLAAGFAGFSSTLSLKALLEAVLDIHLPKTETRSNWLHRPLTPAQLGYAADDVLYLPKLREAILARCKSDTVRGWLSEELAKYNEASLYKDHDPLEMWTRVKGWARALHPGDPRYDTLPRENGKVNVRRFLAVLQEVTAWRENMARKLDWPRMHVLDDATLIDLAIAMPQDAAAFHAIPYMPRRMPDDVVQAALDAVHFALGIPDDECPQFSEFSLSDRRAVRPKCDEVLASIAKACESYGIDPALLISREHLEDIFLRHVANPLASGWREQVLSKNPLNVKW